MDISQESDPKSQDEIPVRPSFRKNCECYVRERYLKKISVVGVYRAAIPSEKFSWECLPPIESLELALLFSIYTNKQLRPWKIWIRTARWFLVSLRQWERNSRQNCCSQGEKFAVNEWYSFGSLQEVSVATIQWENIRILETVNSDLTTLHVVLVS